MDLFKNILMHIEKDEQEVKDCVPCGVCPVCWGYQEYDHKLRKLYKDDQIDVNNHKKKYTMIRKFVRDHIDGIQLTEGKIETCPKCSESHSK